MAVQSGASRPWYRERWPWILMAGPVAVIAAATASAWLAFATSDGLAPEYRLGIAIGQALGRICTTAALGYRSALSLDSGGALEVRLSGGNAPPYALRLRLAHPNGSGLDRVIALETTGKGMYRAPSGGLPAERWLVVLEDDSGIWRLGGEWELVAGRPLEVAWRGG